MKARKFLLCFDQHRSDGKVWAIRVGNRWRCFHEVVVKVTVSTVYHGVRARQPRAYLTGHGVIRTFRCGRSRGAEIVAC